MPIILQGYMKVLRGICTRIFIRTIQVSMVVALAGCAAQTHDVLRPSASGDKSLQNISAALLEGKPAVARETLAAALRSQPQNGYFHLLNGLSYQIEDSSLQSLDLAKVGYDAAVKFAPGHFWSHYLAGSVGFDRHDYAEAAEHFCRAILDDPSRPQAFLGLAISAYFAGDLGVAHAAADRALTLEPKDPLALRTAAYIAAARGERGRLDAVLTKAKTVPIAAQDLALHKTRLTQLLRTASLAPWQVEWKEDSDKKQLDSQSAQSTGPKENAGPNQVMVEITLLLNQGSNTQNTGINLLDGLTSQFGLDYLIEKKVQSGAPDSLSRILTTALHVPQITYSLNLFNRKSDFYRVIARPSLVASVGQQSEFFIGRTLTVGVSGINLGTLIPVDVGTNIKVLLIESTPDHAKFKVDVLRSFFAQETGNSTFQQSLTTFKQVVAATAEVEFGKTLILSGLYEGVEVGSLSKTPGLGDIPGVDAFFNARTRTDRRDVALVLVTPRLPGPLETGTREFRGDTLSRLLSLWKDLIDPTANMDAIIGTIERRYGMSKLFPAKVGDLRLPSVSNPDTVRSIIKDTMAQLQ
jgi:Tfp pilus assembly protein PilF